MEQGYVKLWRKCLDSGLLKNPTAWQLFGYLLLKATHRAHRQLVGGMVFDLQPGDVIVGRSKAADDLGVGEQSIRTALKLLEKLEIVTSRSTNKCTIISFVNWHRYQDDQPAPNQQINHHLTSNQPAPNQHLTTNKNERKKENIKTDTSYLAQSDAGASSAPEPDGEQDQPVAMIPLADGSEFPVPASLASEYAAAYPGVDVAGELAQVRAWCLSNPRKRKTKNGIRRFLNSWLDRAQNQVGGQRASPAASVPWARQGVSRQGGFENSGERREYRGDESVAWA
ncbi:hypothetical protein [uncultured Bilophila sp.]|uniref:hypothetical protein n=1 Tax=uncultured Bilophila sp. TaxID=529385 RepID=UPI002670B307|nr:hypothetical protein [uncultured Bilophila sp.]